MTLPQIGRLITAVAAGGFLATAALHSTGFDGVTRLAEQGPEDLRSLVPALWLAFSIDLIVAGLIVAAVAFRPSPVGRVIVALAAVIPIGAAGLQMRYIGFIPPTAILLAVGVLALVGAAISSRSDPDKS